MLRSLCKHCDCVEVDHGPEKKCLFEATTYEAGDDVIVVLKPVIPVDYVLLDNWYEPPEKP